MNKEAAPLLYGMRLRSHEPLEGKLLSSSGPPAPETQAVFCVFRKLTFNRVGRVKRVAVRESCYHWI